MEIGYFGRAALTALYLLTIGEQSAQSQDLAAKLKNQTAQSSDAGDQQFLGLHKNVQDFESNKLKSSLSTFSLSAETGKSLSENINKLAMRYGLESKKYSFAFTFGESIVAGYQTMRRRTFPDGYHEASDTEYLILIHNATIKKTRKFFTDNYEYREFRTKNNNGKIEVVNPDPPFQPIDPRYSDLRYTDLHQLIDDLVSRRKLFVSTPNWDTHVTEYIKEELNAITMNLGRMHGTDLQQCEPSIQPKRSPKRIEMGWRKCGEGFMVIWPNRVVLSKKIGISPQYDTKYLKPVIKTP